MAEFDSVIPAGESGKLVARVHTRPTQNGRLTKSVTVTTDAPGAENLHLSLSFEAVTPILIRPHSQISLNGVEGEPAMRSVLLHRADGEPLEVRRVESSDPKVLRVETRPAKDGEPQDAREGDVWLDVSLVAGAAPTMYTRGTVTVYTNHPELEVLELPAAIRLRSLIEARPSQVRLWLSEDGPDGPNAIIRLAHSRGGKFRITGLEVTHPLAFSAAAVTTDAQPSHTIRVELAPELTYEALSAEVRGTLKITLDDPHRPRLDVPVVVSRRTVRVPRAAESWRNRPPAQPPTSEEVKPPSPDEK